MLGSAKYQLEGSRLTIITGVEPSGTITRYPISDYYAQYRDEDGNIISIEINGLSTIARSEVAINFGEWSEVEGVHAADTPQPPADEPKDDDSGDDEKTDDDEKDEDEKKEGGEEPDDEEKSDDGSDKEEPEVEEKGEGK